MQSRISKIFMRSSHGFFIYLVYFLNVTVSTEFTISSSNVNHIPANQEVCLSPGCHQTATLIRDNINENVDPCDDFYDFACGGYVNKVKIPPDKINTGRLTNLQDNVFHEIKEALTQKIDPMEPRIFGLAKKFYQACMNLTTIQNYGLQPLRDIIDKLGGWPVVVGDTWNEDKFVWTETDFKLRQMGYNPKTIVNVYVFNNLYNTSRNVLYVDPVVPYISAANLKKGFSNTVVAAYYRYMVDVAVSLGANGERAAIELKESLLFEMHLVQACSKNTGLPNISIKSIEDLEKNVPIIYWEKYLNGFTEPIVLIKKTDAIKVRKPNYFLNLMDLLKVTPKRVVANYMIWRTIAESVPYLNNQIRQIERKFKRQAARNSIHSDRWRQCIDLVTDKKGLTVGVSSLYVRKYFNNETRIAIKTVLYSIVDQLKIVLEKCSWMDKMTQSAALRKSDFMKQIIAYPNELLNDKTIDNYTLSLDLFSDNHFQNFINLNRFHFDYSMAGLHETTDRHLWTILSDSTVTNAYYYIINNAFALLAAMLKPPIFNYNWPDSAKFGSIGWTIGHELMHAYDLKNSVFDETGSYHPWFSRKAKKEYSDRVKCFIDQYSNYVDDIFGFNVNGTLTVNENLPDNVGVEIAFNAYKTWKESHEKELPLPGLKYTPEQIFWITSTNFLCSKSTSNYRLNLLLTEAHTTDEIRTLGTLSNSPDFAKAFNCSVGSPMNPEKKCKLW